jgi:hypothetical protein
MKAGEDQATGSRRPVGLGIAVGWLVLLILKTLVPILVLVGMAYWHFWTTGVSASFQNPPPTSDPVWYAVQAAIGLGTILAGFLAARLAPGRPVPLALGLVAMSLLTTFFEQFPMPLSATAIVIWTAGPCLGLLAGVWLARVSASAAASD